MPNTIKPSEVSEVLLSQLQGIDTSLKFDEVGTVLQVSDGVARIYGLRNAEANELLQFECQCSAGAGFWLCGSISSRDWYGDGGYLHEGR